MILIDKNQIQQRVIELAKEIDNSRDLTHPLTVISILNGSIVFTADLIRQLNGYIYLDSIKASSYKGTTSTGVLAINNLNHIDNIENTDILLVDDILDTGLTLHNITNVISNMKPKSLKTCVLLDKKECRKVPFEATFVGFNIPNNFVIGYGLDHNGLYRNRPDIHTLDS